VGRGGEGRERESGGLTASLDDGTVSPDTGVGIRIGPIDVRRWSESIAAAAFGAAAVLPSAALGNIAIVDAHIGEGDLWIVGHADEPDTEVSLDDSFTTKADARGNFQFRIAYHPSTCMVMVKTERFQRAVVVANCGQRGPQGEQGPPGPAPAAGIAAVPPAPSAPSPIAPPAPAPQIACAAKTPLYTADNGFKMWVVRRGNLAPGGAEPRIVLQVNIDGSLATAHGPDFAHMQTSGRAAQLEQQSGGRIAWDQKLGPLPDTIEIVSEGSGDPISRLRFKECGTPPRGKAEPAARSPQPEPRAEAPPAFPIPQGVFQ
jgi:hypothetical protein